MLYALLFPLFSSYASHSSCFELFFFSLFLSLIVAVTLTDPYAQIYSIPSLVGPLLLG